MGEAAIKSAKAIGYEGAGTVEFLLDNDGSFYFMEMNTRLQVEHPVTEMITKQDLVAWQLRVASGEPLPLNQQQLSMTGHAFEARIYAEDPDNDFLPATGRLNYLQPPLETEHVRVDTGVRQGDDVSIFYDPMIAKLIVWDENRDKALQRLKKALTEYRINGVITNIDFLYNLATSSAFKAAELDTGFIEKHKDELFAQADINIGDNLPLAALYLILQQNLDAQTNATAHNDPHSPWQNTNAWRANEAHSQQFVIETSDDQFTVNIEQKRDGQRRYYLITTNGKTTECHGTIKNDKLIATIDGYRCQATIAEHDNQVSLFKSEGVIHFSLQQPDCGQQDDNANIGGLIAPMNGTIVNVLVTPPCRVVKGQDILIMEAMKMEHTITAPFDGELKAVYFNTGDLVDGGATLVELNPKEN